MFRTIILRCGIGGLGVAEWVFRTVISRVRTEILRRGTGGCGGGMVAILGETAVAMFVEITGRDGVPPPSATGKGALVAV